MKFKLESVLKLRENIEQVKKRELGIATGNRQLLESKKENLVNKKISVQDETRQSASKDLDVQNLKELRLYATHIDGQIQGVNLDIVKANQVVKEKKLELAEAMKQRKMVEKLKEIKREQLYEEEKKQEINLLDEIVSYKYTTKKRGE